MNQLRPFFLLLILGSLLMVIKSCFNSKIDDIDYKKQFTYAAPPPSTPERPNPKIINVQVADNLFCDQIEISNIQWSTYLLWLGNKYGETSAIYQAALPDPFLWKELPDCYIYGPLAYITPPSPFLQAYPVIGINQQQAINFSKWRTERAKEIGLTQQGLIDTAQHSTPSLFLSAAYDLEKLFFGKTPPMPKDGHNYYLKYQLPNLDQRKQILHYSDSVDAAYFNNCSTTYCQECQIKSPDWHTDFPICPIYDEVPRRIDDGCVSQTGIPFYNLRGNAAEWTSEPNIAVGGSWIDTKERILKCDTFKLDNLSFWVGLRNVSQWVKLD